MLDINLIRQNPEYVKERLAAKGNHADIDGLLKMDAEKRAFMTKVEEKKAEQNKVSKMIPAMKKEGKDVSEIMAQMKERDTRDATREIAPAVAAPDAIPLDNSALDLDGSVAAALEIIKNKLGK